MNRILLTALVLPLALFSRAEASGTQPDNARAEAIASSLNLSEDDADRFTKTYQAYQSELKECFSRYPKIRINEQSSDAQIDSVIRNQFAQSKAIIELRQKYYPIWQQFLTQRQIYAMYNAERHLKKRMTEERIRRRQTKRKDNLTKREDNEYMNRSDIERKINSYLSANFPDCKIKSLSIQQDSQNHSNAVLNDGTALKFSKNGKLLGISAPDGQFIKEDLLQTALSSQVCNTLCNNNIQDKIKSIAFHKSSCKIIFCGASGISTAIVKSDGNIFLK